MARVTSRLRVTYERRWWLRPALFGVAFLHHVGMIRDTDRATRWLARNAIDVGIECVANDN